MKKIKNEEDLKSSSYYRMKNELIELINKFNQRESECGLIYQNHKEFLKLFDQAIKLDHKMNDFLITYEERHFSVNYDTDEEIMQLSELEDKLARAAVFLIRPSALY